MRDRRSRRRCSACPEGIAENVAVLLNVSHSEIRGNAVQSCFFLSAFLFAPTQALLPSVADPVGLESRAVVTFPSHTHVPWPPTRPPFARKLGLLGSYSPDAFLAVTYVSVGMWAQHMCMPHQVHVQRRNDAHVRLKEDKVLCVFLCSGRTFIGSQQVS